MESNSCRVLIVLAVFLLFILLVCGAALFFVYSSLGLGGVDDWAYKDLPGSYEIWRFNSQNISVIDADSGGTVISPFVMRFSANERYIGIQQASNEEGKTVMSEDKIKYYVIDADNRAIYGPFGLDAFQKYCNEHNVELNEWKETQPKPEGAA